MSLVYISMKEREKILECIENYDEFCAKKRCARCKKFNRKIPDPNLFFRMALEYFER